MARLCTPLYILCLINPPSLSASFCFSSHSPPGPGVSCPLSPGCCVAVMLCGCVAVLPLTPAKLMNGYMVLTNGGSRSGSSSSLYSRPPSRTLSRPAGDIILSMDSEPSVRKMDTVVKLEAVSLFVCVCVCGVHITQQTSYFPPRHLRCFYL